MHPAKICILTLMIAMLIPGFGLRIRTDVHGFHGFSSWLIDLRFVPSTVSEACDDAMHRCRDAIDASQAWLGQFSEEIWIEAD